MPTSEKTSIIKAWISNFGNTAKALGIPSDGLRSAALTADVKIAVYSGQVKRKKLFERRMKMVYAIEMYFDKEAENNIGGLYVSVGLVKITFLVEELAVFDFEVRI